MYGIGDNTFENACKNNGGSLEAIYPGEDLEIKPKSHQQRYKKNLLINAAKISHILESQSLIDCLEADEECIISAGRDHDINIWAEGLCEGLFVQIRRLSGHHGPVTGLCLFCSGHSTYEKIIVSSSEDGSIRIWSLNTGEEMHKIETGNVITCMGIMNKSLAVIGNHKGYMKVYHLRTGDLYISIRAHADPIDSLQVDGNYACTATFEEPSSLKVWEIQFEQTRCIYRIEDSTDIDFCCLAVWNTKVILGASNEPKLFVIDFVNKHTESIQLNRACGKVESLKVFNEWILSCYTHKTEVFLDVHRFYNYEYYGTFLSTVKEVKAIAAVELESSFKIVTGGSSLLLRTFDFNLTDEETNIPYSRFPATPERNSLMQNKEKSNYTASYSISVDYPDENSSDSDDEISEDEIYPNCGEKIEYASQPHFNSPQNQDDNENPLKLLRPSQVEFFTDDEKGSTAESDFDSTHFKQDNDENPPTLFKKMPAEFVSCHEERDDTQEPDFEGIHCVNTHCKNANSESTMPPRETQTLSVLTIVNPYMRTDSPTEPRVAMRKLREELDKKEEQEDLRKNGENVVEENDDVVVIKEIKLQEEEMHKDNIPEVIELEEDETNAEGIDLDAAGHSTMSNYIKMEEETATTNQELAEKETIKVKKEKENVQNPPDKNFKKNKKSKKDKKKSSKKSKCKRCQII